MRTISLAMILASSSAYGQPADPKPAFEVATIKPSPPTAVGGMMQVGCTGGPGSPDPGRWACQNLTLSNMITNAYTLKGYELSAPSWLRDEKFDITAKIPEGATKEQFLPFQVDFPPREEGDAGLRISGREEVKGSGGPARAEGRRAAAALRSSRPSAVGQGRVPDPARWHEHGDYERARAVGVWEMHSGAARRDFERPTRPGRHRCHGTRGKIQHDAVLVSRDGRPMPPPPPGGGEVPMANTSDGPTIFAAVQEQLGLKLESKKMMIDVLVVDKVEKAPTEN